jgi:hypothetical protein
MDEPESQNNQENANRDVKQAPAAIERPHTAINDAASCYHCHKKQNNWPQGIEAVCAVFLVLITGFYTYYARKQAGAAHDTLGEIQKQFPEIQKSAKAARDAADTSRQSLVDVQRAFIIFPAKASMIFFPRDQVHSITMPIENSGATPAHMVIDRISCVTPIGQLPKHFSFPDQHGKWCATPWAATGASVIPAKGELESQHVFLEDKIVQEFARDMVSVPSTVNRFGNPSRPVREIFVYGWVVYRDIFRDTPEHVSEFCRELTSFIYTPNGLTYDWGYCPTHNCTDDDCPDYKERLRIAHESPTIDNPKGK